MDAVGGGVEQRARRAALRGSLLGEGHHTRERDAPERRATVPLCQSLSGNHQ